MDNADQPEVLVPIRIDMELEGITTIFSIITYIRDFLGHKLRDCFVWNRNERLISPESFAEAMCDDLRVPPGLFVRPISDAIRAQCRNYRPCSEILEK